MTTYFKYTALALATASVLGCSKAADDTETQSTLVTVAGQFNTTVSGAALRTSAINDYSLTCVTLQASPVAQSSTISAEGAFSLGMPQGAPFGCFVVNSSGTPVATVLKTKSSSGTYSSAPESSFSLNSDLDMGTLDLNLDSGKVEVPEARFSSAEAAVSATPTLDLDTIHGQSYNLSCVTSGNTAMDQACASFVQDSPQVFIRILKGTESGSAVSGMGVWASSTEFQNCGSIDLTTSEASAVSGVTFSQITTGSAYTSSNCTLRDSGGSLQYDNIENYYAIGPLSQTPNGWSFIQDDGPQTNGSCTNHHYLALNLSAGTTSGTMVGAFDINETLQGDCGSSQDQKMSFVVTFTPAQ